MIGSNGLFVGYTIAKLLSEDAMLCQPNVGKIGPRPAIPMTRQLAYSREREL